MTIISHLQVDNYRSLHDFKIDLQPLTVLVGRNDAGKSNVLKVIRLLLEDGATDDVDRYDWSRAARNERYPRHLMIEGTLAGEYSMTVRRRITLYKEASATSEFEVADGSGWRSPTDAEKTGIPAVYYLKPRTGALQESFDPSRENNIFTLVKDWMPPDLRQEKQLHKLMRKYAPDETNLAAYVRFFQDKVWGPLKLAFPSDLNLHRYLNPDFRTPTDRGRLFVRELTHANAKEALFRLPLDHHGTGLISIVATVLSVAVLHEYHQQVLGGKPFLIAIEEPEVHLHAHAQRTLLGYFRGLSKQHQVLVATHSAIFVDRAEPNNVIVLRRATQRDEKDSTKAAGNTKTGTTLAISGSYRKNWSDLKEALGLRLSDSLMVGEINLLVEGATETILLPAMAEIWSEATQSSFDFGRVLVVNGEGGNLPYLARLLQSTGNPTLVMVDGDKGGDDILKNLDKQGAAVERLPRPSVKALPHPLSQLKGYEFEDLLDKVALLEAFNEAYLGQSGFEFLPLQIADFDAEQMRLLGNETSSWGWVATVGSLIGVKTTSEALKQKLPSERFSKRRLAESAARKVRERQMPVPNFCELIFTKIAGMLKS